MKCRIFRDRDWDNLQELVSGFLADKKLIEMRQSVVKAGIFEDWHLLVITVIYEEA